MRDVKKSSLRAIHQPLGREDDDELKYLAAYCSYANDFEILKQVQDDNFRRRGYNSNHKFASNKSLFRKTITPATVILNLFQDLKTLQYQYASRLSSLGALKKEERSNEDGKYTRKRFHFLPIFFSLGLHGALASFLFLPSQKVAESESIAIEVKWEEAPRAIYPSSAQSLCDRTTSPTRGEMIHTAKKPSPLVGEGAPKGRVRGITHSQLNTHKELSPQAPLSVAKIPVQKKYLRLSRKPLPKYPWVCRKRGQEGRVSLLVQTNGEGRVVSVSLHKSSGHAALDQSAMSAVKTWVFADDASQKILSIAFHLKG